MNKGRGKVPESVVVVKSTYGGGILDTSLWFNKYNVRSQERDTDDDLFISVACD